MTEHPHRHDGDLEYFKSALEHHRTLAAAFVTLGQGALRTPFLLNGGAIIAVISIYTAKDGKVGLSTAILGFAAICWMLPVKFFSCFSWRSGLLSAGGADFAGKRGTWGIIFE